MCKISAQLRLCTCAVKDPESLKDYWILLRPHSRDEQMMGLAMPPFTLNPEDEEHNLNLLLDSLNSGECFDVVLDVREEDILQLHFACCGDCLHYAFTFNQGKWERSEYDPFANIDEVEAGKIEHPRLKSFLTLAVILFLAPFSYAQIVVGGTVKEAGTGRAVAYVNIGVVGKNIGTVSDDDGKFNLTIPASYAGETVRISMLGYSPQVFKVAEFEKQMADKLIVLQPSSFELPGVVVSNEKLKEKILGNNTESQTTTTGFTSNRLGNEVGIVIKIKKSPTFIKSFQASVVSKDNNPVKLRLNFYSVKDGMPDKLIQDKNIIISAPVENGKLIVDLQKYNIVAEDDFFVSLEWIENDSGRIVFSGSFLKGAIIARETSQGEWEKVGMFGIGFTVKVAY